MILSYPFADVRDIQVIKEGKAAKGAGWGALIGGLALGVVPVIVDGGRHAALFPFCAATGAAVGAGAGAIGGAISDIDDRYPIRPGKWQFHIPPMEELPVEEKSTEPVVENPAEPVVEKPAEPVVEKPAVPVVEKPAVPVVEKPAVPVVEKPTERTEEKKGKTVKDWLEKKKKESTPDEKEE